MMRGVLPSIKGVRSESACHFLRHHVSLKSETMAFEKADAEDEVSHPLIRHFLSYLPQFNLSSYVG